MRQFSAGFKYIAFGLGTISLLATGGCGNNGTNTLLNPQGNYSNASLKGSYVYEIRGADALNFAPYREVGVFIADGSGNITGGSDDATFGSISSVTGNYSIAKDGTGAITMNNEAGTITLAITLVSSSKVYLIEADPTLNATGIAELQDSTAISSTPTGSFAFHIHYEAMGASQLPTAQVGAFTAPGSGVNGAMDQNSAGSFSSPSITWTFNAPGSLGRGTGSFLNAATSGTTNFIYYIVNSGKVDLLSTGVSDIGAGAAEAQSGSISSGLSGAYAFGSSGDDDSYTGGFYGTVATVGEFTASNGNLSGLEDTNVDATITPSVATAGCYTASANGRVAVMNSSGGTCSGTVTQVYWMVSPGRAFFLDLNSGIFDDGTADQQTVSSFSQSTMNGQYALAMGGLDITPELLSRIGTLQFNSSSKLVLNEVSNASATGGGASSPGILSGTYTTSANGRITGSAGNSNGGVDLVMYGVSGSKAYVMQNDSGTVTSGILELQQ